MVAALLRTLITLVLLVALADLVMLGLILYEVWKVLT
jgi:hypothetical protein